MVRRIVLLSSMLVVGLTFMAVLVMVAGTAHADTKHIEAPVVRASIRGGMCQGKEIWFAPKSGRILFLCQLETDPAVYGGWIVFVTQNGGTELIPPHEASVFTNSSRVYWQGVIERDGYMLALDFPTVLDHACDTLGISPLP